MKRYLSAGRKAWFGLLGMVLVLGMAEKAWSQALPEGKGKEVVEAACTECHGTSSFTSSRFSKPDWEFVVNDMIDRGALITAEEKEIIVDYLTEQLGLEEKPKGESTTGKSNVNKAGSGEPVAALRLGRGKVGSKQSLVKF